MNTSHPPVKIYGSGGHSQVIRHVLEENGYRITEVFDDHPEGVHRASVNVVKGLRGKDKNSIIQSTPMVIAIGNNRQRAEISQLLQSNFQKVIHKSAIIASNSTIGDGTVVFAGAIVQPNTVIGKHVIINTAASIDHDNIIGDYAHISPKAALTGHVEIGEGTHVGVGAVIIPTVKIGKWCTIGAGAVVLKDVPDYCTVVGNPGRIIKRQVPPVLPENNSEEIPFDLAFIGAGISTAFTLLKSLKKLPPQSKKIRIAVIEKSGEFFTGVAYGKRSGHSTHLITALKDFLPKPELNQFTDWLNLNKDWLLKRLKEEGGSLTNEWLYSNRKAIQNGKWDHLFIPRSFFGSYIQEKLQETIGEYQKSGKIHIEYVTDEIEDIQREEFGFYLKGLQKNIKTKKAVLGIGSPKQRTLNVPESIPNDRHLFISNPYEQGMNRVIKQIIKSLKSNHKKNVLILGSNASALEFLYKMNDLRGIDSKVGHYFFLSTHGLYPNSIVDTNNEKSFIPKHTLALLEIQKLTAKQIMQGITNDLNDAEELGIGAAITVGPISNAFVPLLEKLDQREKERFACYYGNEIGRRQRVAGYHYTKTIDVLKSQGRFSHLKGSFEKLDLADHQQLSLVYKTEQDSIAILDQPIDIVINCLGSSKLSDLEAPLVIRNLIDSEMAKINPSGRGLTVNQNLETSKGLHVIGPLLAGNVIEGNPIWHVEHCGRIISIAEILSKVLTTPSEKYEEVEPELKIHKLDNGRDVNIYKEILKEYDEHPYYRYEYFKHHSQDDNQLLVVELKHKGRSLAIMPLVKRKIAHGQYSGYFDVTTPYGYGGPLFKPEVTADLKEVFWDLIEKWYQDENIVTEFIRFNHNENHVGYNGEIIPTLKNIKGRILNDPEKQWKQFKPKVRNNYRKAEKNHLTFQSFSGKKISRDHIASFHAVYTETMDRNNAASFYFFHLDYFENLIFSDPDSFILTFAIKDNEIASTELIITHQNSMFAFLGGTRTKFFSYRPNDYLRVEIIEMGRQKGLSWYILGGGRKDNDGLYKSKKHLFPKDEDFVFYTGRKVINREVYNALCGNKLPKHNGYFPKYRVPKLQEAAST
ncbi:peptidoglycan bridge formation glycyltransferase FemA/FemB family protein [Robertkochia marina]|uniref:Peptidoglycan bridge formation glycyltransferase FemA/FemB family protein n=1 Tax=Robertkochia marina TaxID=1227945 RepID=A0A4S3LZA5_9FLAO|nr:NeuD/PglB/VioB family sugar acetyltransferase [Robertkochia marina]THD66766.1 peptidoglycan bridge formation glycyltransferase FemA/FemB family protein [Robertkochia marina]TRZ42345.1 peptidoglycan bridge formation glycyltransferase FemA/FemB family protein [Robertkochia marina]